MIARRSANWNRNWDRRCDHWWRGHRCRFVNGYWYVFGLGFNPWYGYPSGYYAYDYYEPDPYVYDSSVYEGGDVTYGGGVYDSSDADAGQGNDGKDVYDQGAASPVAAAQERLTKQGYYRGQIDGVFGPETRRAIMRYQSDKGLAPTGRLSGETLESLGLRGAAGD